MDFKFLIENIQDKLCAQKGKLLNKASWLTLAKAILSSIPIYSMSIMWLPQQVCNDIIQVVQSFIWVNENKKGINWVNQETMTQPKDAGGLGVRGSHLMNVTMVGKAVWELFITSNKLWPLLCWFWV